MKEVQRMLAIYKREVKNYLHTVIGWLFMSAILFFISLYFVAYNLFSGNPYFANAIGSAAFILLIAVPILTMRVLAEERKQRTDQLILTAPVSVGKIVAGKFMALATMLTLPLLVVCIYPVILGSFGEIEYAQAYVSILGYYVYGLCCIAVGIFISSITENQVIAAVLSFLALFITYMMSGICSLISTSGNLLTKILSAGDFYSRFVEFLQGTLSISSLIYFVSIIAFMLFLTCQSIQKRKWSISSKAIKKGIFSSSLIIISAVLLIAVNLVTASLPAEIKSIDITNNQLYSITDDTKEMLKGLESDVTIYVLASESSADSTVAEMLERYEDASSHVQVVYKDPVQFPQFASAYTSDSLSSGSLIIVSDQRSKAIDYNDLYETEWDYYSYSTTVTGYDGEGQVTAAIQYVLSDNMPKIYLIGGHDELTLETSFADIVEKANIETETITLFNYDAVPDDAAAIIILAPTSDYSTEDAQKVKDYLSTGGKALIVATYSDTDLPNFYSIVEDYGITIQNKMICENNTSYYSQNPFYLVPNIEYSTETADIDDNRLVFMPYSVALSVDEENEELDISEYLTTSDSAVAKADVNNATTSEYEDGDLEGPFCLGVKVIKNEDDVQSQVTVFASEYLFSETADSAVSGTNSMLFSNVIATMADSDTQVVTIPVKSYDDETITVTQSDFILLSMITVILLPLGLLIAGIIIWIRRRRR
jgi:ABC-2 type transport system permease protein